MGMRSAVFPGDRRAQDLLSLEKAIPGKGSFPPLDRKSLRRTFSRGQKTEKLPESGAMGNRFSRAF